MDLVAIDFETACSNPNSACQLAAVVISGSRIIQEHTWRIRPPRLYFSPYNIAVHGIRPEDVRDAPNMEAVWGELSPIIDGQIVVAHNARFDVGVLVASLSAYDIACPDFEFTCTRALARATWPGRPSYGLKPLGSWLGIRFRHHDALEDARCCAEISLRTAAALEVEELDDLERALHLTRGAYRQGDIKAPRSSRRSRRDPAERGTATDHMGFPVGRKRPGWLDPEVILAASGGELPLKGKNIVLLGTLRGMNLTQCILLLTRLGACCQAQVGPDTDFVIACGGSYLTEAERVAGPSTPSTGVRLLSERQFRALLPGGKPSARP